MVLTKEPPVRASWAETGSAGCIYPGFFTCLCLFSKLFADGGWIPCALEMNQLMSELHWIGFFGLSFVSFSPRVKR